MQDEDFKKQVLSCMKRNTEAIEELNASHKKLAEDTEGLIEAWNAGEGIIKVAKAIAMFMKWLTIVGTPIIGLIYWIKTGNWK